MRLGDRTSRGEVAGRPQHRAPSNMSHRLGMAAGIVVATSAVVAGAALAVALWDIGSFPGHSCPASSDPAPRHVRGHMDSGSVSYAFTTLDNSQDPAFNQLLGINNAGAMAGYLGSGTAGHPNQGYVLGPPPGAGGYTSENFPGSAQTQVTGLNNRGVTVGFFSAQNKKNLMNENFGFYASGGRYHEVNWPTGNPASPPVDQLLGVNDHDVAVGFFTNGQGRSRGFTYALGTRRFSRVLVPGIPDLSGRVSLTATAISDSDAVAGFYAVPGAPVKGFVLAAGHATRLAYPGAAMTQPFGISNGGEVVGAYTTGTGSSAVTHGFTWRSGHGFTTVDEPHGPRTTVINAVNGRGDLVGFYTDAAGRTHGFLAAPRR